MSIIPFLSGLVKGKVLVAALLGAALVGGTGVALAATPAGHDLVQHITGTQTHATATPQEVDKQETGRGTITATKDADKQDQKGDTDACAGQSEAQQQATRFSLSTDSKGSAVQVICTLHNGSFQGTVDGKSVTIDHALGYGEIDQLLIYAQSLAAKKGEKLTDSNVQQYVATALNTCNAKSVVPCISGHSNEGKPAGTPTSHGEGKPAGTPTSHDNGKSAGTPTSHDEGKSAGTPTSHDEGKSTGTPTPPANN